jgi:acid stress-induced BolA-like protein IbaG/YrbA
MYPNEVKDRIAGHFKSDQVHVREFSGGIDHYEVFVVSDQFDGLMSLKRHRLVMELFRSEIDSGEVHALSIKAYTPGEWETRKAEFGF